MNTPPFPLFILDANIDNEYINRTLTRTHDWDALATWDLWLATASYDDMPKRPDTRQPPPSATKPPIPASFKSPWVGKTVEECALWLQNAPSDSAVLWLQNSPSDSAVLKDHFTAMDGYSRGDDTVLTCRVKWDENGDGDGNGELKVRVEYYPMPTEQIAMMMLTNRGSYFEERGSAYQSGRKAEGKEDRSWGGPFD